MIWHILVSPNDEILSSKRQPRVFIVDNPETGDGHYEYSGEPDDFTRNKMSSNSTFGIDRYTKDDIFNTDGTFKAGFSQNRVEQDEKPQIGMIRDGATLRPKTQAEQNAQTVRVENRLVADGDPDAILRKEINESSNFGQLKAAIKKREDARIGS